MKDSVKRLVAVGIGGRCMRDAGVLASVLLALASVGAGRAAAATLTVCPRGCPYTQIGPALAAASNGDTIEVAAGTYHGGLTVGLSVKLVGAGAGATIISGDGTVLTIGSFGVNAEPTVFIDGVTITRGVARSSPESAALAGHDGVWALGGVVEIPPKAISAGGFAGGATVTITNSVITGNSTAPSASLPSGFAFAGGAGVDNWGTLTLNNTTVSDNQAGGPVASDASGAGIQNWRNLTLRHTAVLRNRSITSAPHGCSAEGGGITSPGKLTIAASAVTGNTAELSSSAVCGDAHGGGIFVTPHASATISDTTVSHNRVAASSTVTDASSFAGGIAGYGKLALRDSMISGNLVSAATTAATGTANPTSGGLGIVFPGKATISDTFITGNDVSATAATGTAVAEAGGIQTTDTTLSDSLVSGNRLTATSQTGSATVRGAGIDHGNGLLDVSDTTVSDNTATANGPKGQALGGGVWNDVFFPPPPNPRLTLTKTTVTGNTLTASPGITVHGGGLFTTFPTTLTDSTISGNSPDNCFGVSC